MLSKPRVTPIEIHLELVRDRLSRVDCEELTSLLARGGVLVDIRPQPDRDTEGLHPDAIVIDRNVLEWRLDPSSKSRSLEVAAETPVILMCNDGYASSLAAAGLLDMGFTAATDLIGGYRAWAAQV